MAPATGQSDEGDNEDQNKEGPHDNDALNPF